MTNPTGNRRRPPETEDNGPLSEEHVDRIKEELIWQTGYGKPPIDSRFQKGQSGNPKGRPRKAPAKGARSEPPSVSQMMLEETRRPIAVKEGARSFEMPAKQAVMRAQVATAIKGSPIAQKNVLEQTERLEREEQEDIAANNELWGRYVAEQRARIAEAAKRGEPDPKPIPHPDDIIIEPGLRVRFDGPIDAIELAQVEERCRLRTTLLLQYELDQREEPAASTSDDTKVRNQSTAALVFARLLNNGLPTRWRLDDLAMIFEILRNEAQPQRELLKTVYRQWRSFGLRPHRGQAFPPLDSAVRWLNLAADMLAADKGGEIDLASMARGEFDERARAFIASVQAPAHAE
jgi:hypothetical protein